MFHSLKKMFSKKYREHDRFIDQTVEMEEALTRCLAIEVAARFKGASNPGDNVLFTVADAMVKHTNLDGVSVKDANVAYMSALVGLAEKAGMIEVRQLASSVIKRNS